MIKKKREGKKNRRMNKYKQIKSEIGDVNECTTDVTMITKPKPKKRKKKAYRGRE